MSLSQTEKLLSIMAQLRDPSTGCAWDQQQSFESLIPYTLEEAYEVADAIERGDNDDLKSELGDLLLQVVFYAQIAKEQKLFDFEQVAMTIADKLTRRHPHVFSNVVFEDDAARKQAWEEAKALERKEKQGTGSTRILSGLTKNLPALMACEKVQERAAAQGFDWQETAPVFDKVLEELAEVKEAWISGDYPHTEEEVGDLLLVVVNLARHLKVNPEMALRKGTDKFTRRFNYVEQQVLTSGRAVTDCELEELDALWDEAKRVLKQA